MKTFNSNTPHADILSQVEIGERFIVTNTPGLVGLFFLQKTGPRSCRRVHLDRANPEELSAIRQALNHTMLPRVFNDMHDAARNCTDALRDYDESVADFGGDGPMLINPYTEPGTPEYKYHRATQAAMCCAHCGAFDAHWVKYEAKYLCDYCDVWQDLDQEQNNDK